MNVGRTMPCLLAVDTGDGREAEVVAKFSAGCDLGVSAMVAEAYAAMLAIDLALPVPAPLAVEFDPPFAANVRSVAPEVGERMLQSNAVAFGSTKLSGGFIAVAADGSLPGTLVQQAAEIFAFDALISNPDRRRNNPNCQGNGETFAVFDHEAAFTGRLVIGFRPPWLAGGLDSLTQGEGEHLFHRELKGRKVDFSRFSGAWSAITDERLNAYRLSLPTEWNGETDAIDYAGNWIRQVRDHIDDSMAEVGRVLI